MAAFQIHTDQENLNTFGAGLKGGHELNPRKRGKVFQDCTPNIVNPARRALGDLNVGRETPLPGKAVPLKPLTNKPSTKKANHNQQKGLTNKKENRIFGLKNKQINNQENHSVQKKVTKKCRNPSIEVHKSQPPRVAVHGDDDIERMPKPPLQEDDYEDLWPKRERVSTYFDKLISWRPPCLFGDDTVISSDDDLDAEIASLDLIDTLPKPTVHFDLPEICMEDLKAKIPMLSIDEIPFPFIDETIGPKPLEDSFTKSLEDSFNGGLQGLDSLQLAFD